MVFGIVLCALACRVDCACIDDADCCDCGFDAALPLRGLAHPLMTGCCLVVLEEVSLSLWWCSCFLVSAAAFVNLMIVFTFAFQAASGALDTVKGLVVLFCGSCVCVCLLAHDMQHPGSSEPFESIYASALFYSGSRAEQPSLLFWDAASALGLRKWPSVSSCCLLACYAFVAVSGLAGPSGGNSFQPLDAMLAALLFSGTELVGHFARFCAIESSRSFLEKF